MFVSAHPQRNDAGQLPTELSGPQTRDRLAQLTEHARAATQRTVNVRAIAEAALSVGLAVELGRRGWSMTAAMGAAAVFFYASPQPVHGAVAAVSGLWSVWRLLGWVGGVVHSIGFT